jgi:hypothetical protein
MVSANNILHKLPRSRSLVGASLRRLACALANVDGRARQHA